MLQNINNSLEGLVTKMRAVANHFRKPITVANNGIELKVKPGVFLDENEFLKTAHLAPNLTLADAYRYANSNGGIHVVDSTKQATTLKIEQHEPQYNDHDLKYINENSSSSERGNTTGKGTKEDPFECPVSSSVSALYGVAYLWSHTKNSIQPGSDTYIRVNDWLLKVSPEGVTAEDGTFTRLVPQ